MNNNFTMVTPYTYLLAANQRLAITGRGSVIAVDSASYPFQIEVDSQVANAREGVVLRAAVGGVFDGVVLINSGVAQTVTVLIGDGDVTLPIPTVVKVADGGRDLTLNNTEFMGFSNLTNVSGQYGFVQIWNPATSGHDLFVRSVHLSSIAVLGWCLMFRNAAALGVNDAAPVGMSAAGPDDSSQCRAGLSTSLPDGYMSRFFIPRMTQNESKTYSFSSPIQIVPGTGLVVCELAVNKAIECSFEYSKHAI
jgi:hypothetical protein